MHLFSLAQPPWRCQASRYLPRVLTGRADHFHDDFLYVVCCPSVADTHEVGDENEWQYKSHPVIFSLSTCLG